MSLGFLETFLSWERMGKMDGGFGGRLCLINNVGVERFKFFNLAFSEEKSLSVLEKANNFNFLRQLRDEP